MAVLKYGLNSENISNKNYIPEKEVPADLPEYMRFSDAIFEYNIGIHSRGLGQTQKDTTFFVIGKRPTLQDSIQYVEDLILQELALETAFEGNRFHDLMRLAIRRNDDSFLANIVAEKYTDAATKASIRSKLSDRRNWYIK